MTPHPDSGADTPASLGRSTALTWQSSVLALTTALAAGAGMLFWVAAGRSSDPGSVAVASAAWSAATLAGLCGSAGAGASLAMMLSRHPRPRALVLAYAAVSGAVSAVLSVPLSAWLLNGIPTDATRLGLAIGAAAALLSVGAVADGSLIDQGRSRAVLLRNSVASLAKVPAAALWPLSAVGLLTVSAAAVLASVAVSARASLDVRFHGTARRDRSRSSAWMAIASNHVSTVCLSAPALLAPAILVRSWGPDEFAPYFPTWIVISTYIAGSVSVIAAFLAHRVRGLGASLRRDGALRALLGIGATVPLAGVALEVAPHVLGSGYEGASRPAVGLLLAAVVATLGAAGVSAVLRSWGYLLLVACVLLVGSVVSVALTAAASPHGAETTSACYFTSQTVLAAVLLTLMAVLRRRRPTRANNALA